MMQQFYIKGFYKRYSIREDGNVIRHYRFNRKGEKVYNDGIVNKSVANKSVNYGVCLIKNGEKHGRDFLLGKLMIEYFDLTTPDDDHNYRLAHRNGIKEDYSLDNIHFQLYLIKEYNFYPIIYREDRQVLSKKCGCCGEKKEIKDFKKNKRGKYLHDCKTCCRRNERAGEIKLRQYFIEGFDEKYSIREDGNVVSNYLINNKGNRTYRERIIGKWLSHKTPVVSLYTPKSASTKEKDTRTNFKTKVKNISVYSLMIKYFNIQKPDEFHNYEIYPFDGDENNTELKNLKYKISFKIEYPYKINIFYNDDGDILSKICGICGKNVEIKHYSLSSLTNGYNIQCNPCRGKKGWELLKKNPEGMERKRATQIKYNKLPHVKERNNKLGKMRIKNISNSYLNTLIRQQGLDPSCFTEEMKDIYRLNIKIKREINIKS